ncbi:MAG TPA: hypothetical protein VG897_03165 [Terriglobales bacterium]|nr:hypothetical protein [Bryobacteraceae bacterium]HVZ16091.1 hypothetical protein [Terriglobales bacterium]
MPAPSKGPEFKAEALRKIIAKQPLKTQELFAKIINLYAGFSITAQSEKELLGRVRREIEDSVK